MKRKFFYLFALICGASLFSSAGKTSDSCACVETAIVSETLPASATGNDIELGTVTITQFF